MSKHARHDHRTAADRALGPLCDRSRVDHTSGNHRPAASADSRSCLDSSAALPFTDPKTIAQHQADPARYRGQPQRQTDPRHGHSRPYVGEKRDYRSLRTRPGQTQEYQGFGACYQAHQIGLSRDQNSLSFRFFSAFFSAKTAAASAASTTSTSDATATDSRGRITTPEVSISCVT